MDPAVLRADMVDGLLHESRAALEDESVEAAMLTVPRHEFLEDDRTAYADRRHERLGTQVLAPSTVARLVQALDVEGGESTLIVGAGVGYTAAVVAEIVGERNVHAVDIARPVVHEARANLASAGYDGVLVDCRDGAEGLPEYAPFDRILIETAVRSVPRALDNQLADTGRVVFPRGGRPQEIVALEAGDTNQFGAVSMNPLLVRGEQTGAVERNRTEREDIEHALRRNRSRSGWERDWIEWESR